MDNLEREIEIAGMTFETYSPDNDPSGAIGIALAEIRHNEQEKEKLERLIHKEEKRAKYASFLKDAQYISSNNYTEMRRILIKHFTGRFGSKGKQPIKGYNEEELYGLYQGVLRHAQRIVEE